MLSSYVIVKEIVPNGQFIKRHVIFDTRDREIYDNFVQTLSDHPNDCLDVFIPEFGYISESLVVTNGHYIGIGEINGTRFKIDLKDSSILVYMHDIGTFTITDYIGATVMENRKRVRTFHEIIHGIQSCPRSYIT